MRMVIQCQDNVCHRPDIISHPPNKLSNTTHQDTPKHPSDNVRQCHNMPDNALQCQTIPENTLQCRHSQTSPRQLLNCSNAVGNLNPKSLQWNFPPGFYDLYILLCPICISTWSVSYLCCSGFYFGMLSQVFVICILLCPLTWADLVRWVGKPLLPGKSAQE